MSSYLDACQTPFWREVFKKEFNYLLPLLKDYKNILSVGCGPAIIEAGLLEHGLDVSGMDVSKEALQGSPDKLRKFIGSAENMDFFQDNMFDAAIYVTSLQFITNYKKAIAETHRVLKPGGKAIFMLLNPESKHYSNWTREPDSYMCKIKHLGLSDIENTISNYFKIKTPEYFLGIDGEKVFESKDPKLAALYVVKGIKN